MNEVRFCYEQALAREPDLAGRTIVKFGIAPTGTVQYAAVADSNLGASVDQCVAQAVRRWQFPREPGGGLVMVGYPFVFQKSGQSLADR